MWFRNLQLFRLSDDWRYSADALTEALARAAFTPCGKLDRSSSGWVPPRGEEGTLVFNQNGHQLIALGIEKKLLPAVVVRQHAEAKAAEIEAQQGYRPGRKQMREIREQMEIQLLPRALPQRSLVYAWIDTTGRWLCVDSASSARADLIVEALKVALGELPLVLVRTSVSPGFAMTQWLASGEAPGRFTIDRDGELQAKTEERGVVRYQRHALDGEDVRGHLAAGKAVTRLALTWNDRVSFVLTEKMEVKRLAFLDVLKEDAERQAEEGGDLFAANFLLMAGELSALLGDLVIELGGEAE